MGEMHVVPLAQQAVDILRAIVIVLCTKYIDCNIPHSRYSSYKTQRDDLFVER